MTALRLLPAVAAALMVAPAAFGFVNQPSFVNKIAAATTHGSDSTTSLYISSWGTGSSPFAYKSTESENIEENVQAYLKAPEAVEARVNVDGACLVSGLVKSKERTDQTMFDLLNHEDSAFEFDKIVAFVDDIKFAKKRLLSRSARYTGLLDKLDFKEAAAPGALPTEADLEGVKSWVAYLDATTSDNVLAEVEGIAEKAKAVASVENVAILLTNANGLDAAASKAALDKLQGGDSMAYTLVAVGKIEEHQEGSEAYRYTEFGTDDGVLPDTAVFSRDESLRMITELLQLECGKDKALCFREVYNANITEARLIKGLREAGYARPQEIDHMIRDGPKAYKEAVEKWKTEYPDAAKGYTSDAWWESEEFQKSVKARQSKNEKEIQMVKDAKQEEVEKIAKEWAKREYFRESMSADGTKLTKEEYIESVWERALFEGDLKYRETHNEDSDPQGELVDFKALQERKQVAMLKRAKQELRDVLDEENLGGDVPGLDDDEEKPEDPDDKKMS
ncbi:expressed unknown protein [Seminavis robusta]|uniref:Uncharacterized protein n=1 Tax=Seminavis robusta TaxID=568900 RepID=A0A9N8E2G6_9STRA|nr:expressed unknown protein [Seminavis robusta]|eukprot:Sro552_g165040.1 n/a (507) ;mRNA; r:16804-18466